MSAISQLGQVPISQYESAVTLIRKIDDNHMQLIVERWVLSQNDQFVLKTFIAEFGGRKISYEPPKQGKEEFNIGIGIVACKEIQKPIKSLLKSKTWVLCRERVESVWKEIELEAFDRNLHPQLYCASGNGPKKPFYKTSHPLLVTIRNMDPLLFDKLYTHCVAVSNAGTPLELFEQIVQDNCHWKTAERVEKILPKLKEKSEKANLEQQEFTKAFRELKSFVDLMISKTELEKIHADWAYKAGYTKWSVFTSPSIEVLAYWIAIYHLMKTIMMDPDHEHKIELIELKPHNCDTWASEKAEAMGADVNNGLAGIIALPALRCATNSQAREDIEFAIEFSLFVIRAVPALLSFLVEVSRRGSRVWRGD